MEKYFEDGMYVITSKGSSESSSESKPSKAKKLGSKKGYYKIVEDINEGLDENSQMTIFNSDKDPSPRRIKTSRVKKKTVNKKSSKEVKNSSNKNKHSSPFDLKSAFDKSSGISQKMSFDSLPGNSSSNSLSKQSLSKKKSDKSKKVKSLILVYLELNKEDK